MTDPTASDDQTGDDGRAGSDAEMAHLTRLGLDLLATEPPVSDAGRRDLLRRRSMRRRRRSVVGIAAALVVLLGAVGLAARLRGPDEVHVATEGHPSVAPEYLLPPAELAADSKMYAFYGDVDTGIPDDVAPLRYTLSIPGPRGEQLIVDVHTLRPADVPRAPSTSEAPSKEDAAAPAGFPDSWPRQDVATSRYGEVSLTCPGASTSMSSDGGEAVERPAGPEALVLAWGDWSVAVFVNADDGAGEHDCDLGDADVPLLVDTLDSLRQATFEEWKDYLRTQEIPPAPTPSTGPDVNPGVAATWSFAPGDEPTPDGVSFRAHATRLACSGGVTGAIDTVAVEESETEVIVTVVLVPLEPGGHRCPGNDAVPFTVDLSGPIGDRALVDAACLPGRAAATTALCLDGGVRWEP